MQMMGSPPAAAEGDLRARLNWWKKRCPGQLPPKLIPGVASGLGHTVDSSVMAGSDPCCCPIDWVARGSSRAKRG
ncbi:MAG: hypothetical protein RL743_750 [Actinomycetota bacterium]|jgi:hypothetical protein